MWGKICNVTTNVNLGSALLGHSVGFGLIGFNRGNDFGSIGNNRFGYIFNSRIRGFNALISKDGSLWALRPVALVANSIILVPSADKLLNT